MQAIAQINTQVWVLQFEEYMERLKNAESARVTGDTHDQTDRIGLELKQRPPEYT